MNRQQLISLQPNSPHNLMNDTLQTSHNIMSDEVNRQQPNHNNNNQQLDAQEALQQLPQERPFFQENQLLMDQQKRLQKCKVQNFYLIMLAFKFLLTASFSTFQLVWVICFLSFGHHRKKAATFHIITSLVNFALYVWAYILLWNSQGLQYLYLLILIFLFFEDFWNVFSLTVIALCSICCACGVLGCFMLIFKPIIQKRKKSSRNKYYAVLETLRNKSPVASPSSEDECSICLAEEQDKTKCIEIECNHNFHIDCLKMWLEEHNTCPICRKDLY